MNYVALSALAKRNPLLKVGLAPLPCIMSPFQG